MINPCAIPQYMKPRRADRASSQNMALLGHIGGPLLAVTIQGDYAYLGFSHELVVLDIRNRAQPRWVSALFTPANEISLAGRYAYLPGREGLRVVDILDPTRPKLAGHWASADTAASAAVAGDYVYVVNRVAVVGRYAYLVTDAKEFLVVDIEKPTAPVVVSRYQTADVARDLVVEGAYAYIAAGKAGVQVLAIADPARIQEAGYYQTDGEAVGITLAAGRIYVADRYGGLLILAFMPDLNRVPSTFREGTALS